MRRFILSLTLLFFTACMGDKKPTVTPQSIKEKNSTIEENALGSLTLEQVQLKSALENYLSQLKSLNAENIISMTYPKLFIPINQDKFRSYLNTMLISPEIQIDSFEAVITKLGAVQTFNNGEFAHIDYHSTIVINFINPQLYSTQRKLLILDKILSNKYGRENIRVDSINRIITIKKDEKLLAIKESADSWKFLGDNREYRRLYPRILPNDLLNKI